MGRGGESGWGGSAETMTKASGQKLRGASGQKGIAAHMYVAHDD